MYTVEGNHFPEILSISAASNELCATLPNGDVPIVIGSLGRRVSVIADATGGTSLDSCIENMDSALTPRLSERGLYDIDFILDPSLLSWFELAAYCEEISINNGRVELDPHFGVVRDGYLLHSKSRAVRFPATLLTGKYLNVGPPNLDRYIFVPDLPTQLAYMLNIQRLRPKDVSEINYFYNVLMKNQARYSNFPNFTIAKELLGSYLTSAAPIKDAAKYFYHHIPQGSREKLSLKKRFGLCGDKETTGIGFNSIEAIYV